MLKEKRGITLIALVITIIVLLILAGVTIATLTGENGVLTKATTAKEQSIIGEEKEAVKLAYTTCKTNDYTAIVTNSDLQDELNKIKENGQVSSSGDDLIVWFKDTNHRYTVNQDGTIEQIEDLTPEEADKVIDMLDSNIVLTADGTTKYIQQEFIIGQMTEMDLSNSTVISENGLRKKSINCFLDGKGKVYTWGDNDYGQLGNGEEQTATSNEPICISDIPGNILNKKNVVDIYSNGTTMLALDNEGKVYGWGNNYFGQLGNGEEQTDSNVPICISDISTSVLNGKKIEYIESQNITIALDSEGKVYTWGEREMLGDESTNNRTMPRCISDIVGNELNGKKIVDIYLDKTTAMALDSEGKLYTWGDNMDGQLGDGTTTSRNVPKCISDMPDNELNGKKVTNMYVNFRHGRTVIVLDDEEKVYLWGNNGNGQIGNGSTEEVITLPICISEEASNLKGKGIEKIYPLGELIALIDNEGKTYTWGNNSDGQLGDGTTIEKNIPECISDIENSALKGKIIKDIYYESGNRKVMAIGQNEELYMWGKDVSNMPVNITQTGDNALNNKYIVAIYFYSGSDTGNMICYLTQDGKILYETYFPM